MAYYWVTKYIYITDICAHSSNFTPLKIYGLEITATVVTPLSMNSKIIDIRQRMTEYRAANKI